MEQVKSVHTSVLLQEAIDGLNIRKGCVYLDCTLGGAGHAEYAIRKAGGEITVIALDQDKIALEKAKRRLENSPKDETRTKIIFREANFRDLDKILDELHIDKVNSIIFDLGLSSDQLDVEGKGFSFKRNEPLLMTFSEDNDLTAEYILNNWQENTLADIIYGYGEERYARKIAKSIIEYRKKKKIETTDELVDIISKSVPPSYKRGRLHYATRTFQALRIAVNDELNALKDGIRKGFERLSQGGRMSVISFHSLEDRIVKDFYKKEDKEDKALIITKKPIVPMEEEIRRNPRSRSAKLRIIEKK